MGVGEMTAMKWGGSSPLAQLLLPPLPVGREGIAFSHSQPVVGESADRSGGEKRDVAGKKKASQKWGWNKRLEEWG